MTPGKRKEDEDSENTPKRIRTTDEPVSKKRREISQNGDPSPLSVIIRASECSKAGVVKKLHMKNFMCHSSLEINLHPNINFIVGRNGSGKSAILTALVVGLGGKASATNRASSLKDFIKKGTNTSTIEITLNNMGIYCYKPEEYGDNIIVTRTLNATTGQSSYKLKSQNGSVISAKKEELDRIISAFNIQVDNPVSVLNQDSARTFLNTSDPHQKYALFMKATQIEKLHASYNESLAEKIKATEILKSRNESIHEATKEVNELEHKWKTLKSLGDYRKKAEELENELFWIDVVEQEKNAELYQKNLKELSVKFVGAQTDVNAVSTRENEIKGNLRKIEKDLKEKKALVTTCEKMYIEHKEEARKRREEYGNKLKVFKTMEAKSERMNDNVATLKQAIENYNSASTSDQEAKRIRIQQEIKSLDERQKDVQQSLKVKKQFQQQLMSNMDKIKNDQHSLFQEKQEHTYRIDQKQREIRNLKNESHNSLTVFGAWVPRVSQKIDEAFKKGLFSERPRGPLGAYIKLKDASWAPAIESFLGIGLLQAYRVNTTKDSNILSNIFKDVIVGERAPTVISSKFSDMVYDVRKFQVQSDRYSNILNMLIISDVVTCNTLIDEREIESVLLIPTDSEASKIMSNANLVPRRCKRAITKRGDQFYPDPNYRTYAGEAGTKAKFLQVSMQDAIRAAEDDLRNSMIQREEIDRQLKIVENRVSENTNEIHKVNASIRELRSEDFNIQSKLTELKDIEEPEPNSVQSLVSELRESQDAYEKAKEEKLVAETECQTLKEKFEEIEQKVKEVRDNCREMQNEEMPLLNEKASLQNELKEIQSRKNFQDEKYKEVCKEIAAIEAKLSKQRDKIKKSEETALQRCPRMETNRSRNIVEKELIGCKRYMASVEKHTGSMEEVGKAYIEKKTKYGHITGHSKVLETSLKKLDKMLLDRKKLIHTVERLSSLRVQHMFQSLMHSRKYMGRLKIDHEQRTLSILVCPGNIKERGMMDTKTLSGGERSFSTVSFFMALWDTVEPPFYFLDEFDVFMDKVNRHIIMDLLLEHARQKKCYQFVFLTPQDASHIHSDPDIKIHRMEDPRRTNT